MAGNLVYDNSSGIVYSNYFNPKFSAPLDPRSIVNTKAALTDILPNCVPYRGMLVIVLGDTDDNNGAYYLKDSDASVDSNWVKIGDGNITGINWPPLDPYDPNKVYYLKYKENDDGEADPEWVEFTQEEQEHFRLGVEDMYTRTSTGYSISDDTKTILTNTYTTSGDGTETAEVVAIHEDTDRFYLMLNPELVFTFDGGNSEASQRCVIDITPHEISKSVYEVSASNPMDINFLYTNNYVSTTPENAEVTWYSDEDCSVPVGDTENTPIVTTNPHTITDSSIYQSGDVLERWAIARKEGWLDSWSKKVRMEIIDDTISITVEIIDTQRTNAESEITQG